MLSVSQRDLAAATEETGRIGAGTIRGALTPEARHGLVAALESGAFERAPERVGDVRQDFDLLVMKPGLAAAAPALAPLLALAEEYAALLRAQAEQVHQCPRIMVRLPEQADTPTVAGAQQRSNGLAPAEFLPRSLQ